LTQTRTVKIHDRVLLTLCCLGAAALAFGGFLSHAGNRLANGVALPLWRLPAPDAAAIAGFLAALLALCFVAGDRLRAIATLAAGAALFFACLAAVGHAADLLALGARAAARTSLGPAFWIVVAVALLSMLHGTKRARLSPVSGVALGAALAGGFALMAQHGAFANLALAREFDAHRAEFLQQLTRHLFLVGAAVGFALVFSVPLTALALRDARARGVLFGGLGVVQTIPSIALFGALIAPLSALSARFPALRDAGISGTGPAPAIIALTLYSLPPLVRIFVTGFSEVAMEVRDAATGLGFDSRRLLFAVELPLAAPALISGLRVVAIQAIGLAAVAALIGAGGLGVFVFQGIGQYALDLVLLGAIPIILLALAADLLFQMALSAARRRNDRGAMLEAS
jgi:osmoprotectant transport system permease protein